MSRQRKYKNVPIVVDGERFDSKREYERHCELCLLERAGKIRDLKRQVTFTLMVNGHLIGKVRPDWTYTEIIKDREWPGIPFGQLVAEDSKGFATPDWRTRWRLAKALHPTIDWRISGACTWRPAGEVARGVVAKIKRVTK